MSYTQGPKLYSGKAKDLYQIVENPNFVWVSFKDDMTAFNGEKKVQFDKKGELNCSISTLIFKHLKAHSVESHWIETVSPTEMICEKMKVIPLEVIVRNVLAGSTAKKLQIKEGTALAQPLIEFFYKDDSLNDPFINDEHAVMLNAISDLDQAQELKRRALEINKIIFELFDRANILLVDFKIEFGLNKNNEIVLVDEISPDSCRLWDKVSHEKMDKDRFRRELGDVMSNYSKVLGRLEKVI